MAEMIDVNMAELIEKARADAVEADRIVLTGRQIQYGSLLHPVGALPQCLEKTEPTASRNGLILFGVGEHRLEVECGLKYYIFSEGRTGEAHRLTPKSGGGKDGVEVACKAIAEWIGKRLHEQERGHG